MSLLPLLIRELAAAQESPDIYDQHFGLGLFDNDLHRPTRILAVPFQSGYLRPWRNVNAGESGLSTMQTNKNEFKVSLDVQQFKPEELKVKVEDGFIVVDAKHEERSDQHGFISRQFTRRYRVPEDVDLNGLKSDLSSDGVLSLKAPKKAKPTDTGREIPITFTNAPAVKSKTEEKENKVDEKSKL